MTMAILIKKLRMFVFGWKPKDLHPDIKPLYLFDLNFILPINRMLFPERQYSPNLRMILAAEMKYKILKKHYWNNIKTREEVKKQVFLFETDYYHQQMRGDYGNPD